MEELSSIQGPVLNHKNLIKFVLDKHSSLFVIVVNDKENSFTTLTAGVNVPKLFFFVSTMTKPNKLECLSLVKSFFSDKLSSVVLFLQVRPERTLEGLLPGRLRPSSQTPG